MLKAARYLYHNFFVANFLFNKLFSMHQFYRIHFIDERKFIKELNLVNRTSLIEKVNWLKLKGKFRKPLKINYYSKRRERQYTNIKTRCFS